MSFEIKPNPDTAGIIDIYERDLGTHPCYCMCYFDFTHILEGLEPGDYLARVWEASYDEEYTLAGVTSFVIKARLTPYTITTLMSECYDAEGAEEPPASPHTGLELTNVSANPARQSAQIRYFLPADARVALEIYDVTGTRVRTLNVGGQERGEHLRSGASTFWSGTSATTRVSLYPEASTSYDWKLRARLAACP
jgi:hypothetical protein